jgi:alpha-1,3-rhamnosyl/mannosyltransferase
VSAGEIVRYLRFPPARLQVVHLAGAPDSGTAPASMRRPDLLLAMGNRRPHKNFDGLVRALALVDAAIRPHLVITGSRGDDPLLPIVRELQLEPWVDLRVWVPADELARLASTATALAVPSFAEGFGLPILEAMGSGLPVVISDLPVFREVASDAAIYFDPADLASIARAITRLVTEPDLRSQLRDAGIRRAGEFNWSRVASETLDGFRSALSVARPSRSRNRAG